MPKRKTNAEDFAPLFEKLGHSFANLQLLTEALTHPSLSGARTTKSGAPYERLEFLGDRVLGLVIAEWLYQLYPQAREGDLAKRHASLVNRDALRHVARTIDLGAYLRLAHGEIADAARRNLATLPDAMEALIGATYLDGGLEAAKTMIHRHWSTDIETAEIPVDAKTALQEWAQAKALPLPIYRVVKHAGPAHAPKFTIELTVTGYDAIIAEGDSKRMAEKAAALAFLAQHKTEI